MSESLTYQSLSTDVIISQVSSLSTGVIASQMVSESHNWCQCLSTGVNACQLVLMSLNWCRCLSNGVLQPFAKTWHRITTVINLNKTFIVLKRKLKKLLAINMHKVLFYVSVSVPHKLIYIKKQRDATWQYVY